MKTYAALVVLGLFAPLSQAQIILSENFDSQTTGNTVSGFTAVTPSTATPRPTGRGSVIVDDTLPNKALNVYDYDTANPTRVEQDFGPLSAAHVSLNFRRNADIAIDTSAESTRAFYLTMGLNGTSQGTQANRAIEVRLYNNGAYRFNRGVQDSGGNLVSSNITPAAFFESSGPTFNNHSLDLFVYSGVPGGSTLSYTGPDSSSRLLDPNSFAVFIDGAFITPPSGATANGNFGIFNSAFYPNASDLGRMGFVSGGAAAISGVDFIIDNVVLSQIPVPEPSSVALLALGGMALVVRKRRNS